MTASTYTAELRVLLCPHCGAPVDVAIGGGAVQCSFCSVQLHIVGRKPAVDLGRDAAPNEPERLRRLRAQEDQPLLPPPGIAHLVENGAIPDWRADDALAAWQSARERTSEGSHEAAEELVFLDVVLGNRFMRANDGKRHRAMLESALEAFFLPRHRSIVAAELCMGACRERDTLGARAWLAHTDAASDDLYTDSGSRLARAAVAMQVNDHAGMLAALGESAADVPVHDAFDATIAVHRAHALERLGRGDAAARELRDTMARSDATHATIESIVRGSGLAAASLAAATRAGSRWKAAGIASLIAAGVLAIGVVGALFVAGDAPWLPLAAFGAAGVALVLMTAGLVATTRR